VKFLESFLERGQALDRKYVQFIKIEATIPFLMKYAEILNINKPLRPDLVNVINNIKQLKMEKYVAKEDETDGEENLSEEDEEEDDEPDGEEIEEIETGSCLQGWDGKPVTHVVLGYFLH